MRAFNYLLSIIVFGLLVACNSGASGSKKDQVIDKSALPDKVFPLEIQKGGSFESVQEIRMQAKAVIESRISKDPDPLAMITHDYFLPEFVFNGKEMSKRDEYMGYWIKFDEDFTYKYGYYDALAGTGIYHYRNDDEAMVLLNDDEELEPKSYILRTNGRAFALVGRHDYGVNNGMQIKLETQSTKPQKPYSASK
jgi:hypothetical protein